MLNEWSAGCSWLEHSIESLGRQRKWSIIQFYEPTRRRDQLDQVFPFSNDFVRVLHDIFLSLDAQEFQVAPFLDPRDLEQHQIRIGNGYRHQSVRAKPIEVRHGIVE